VHAALAIVGESDMVVFSRTNVVPGFVTAASNFVIGEEVRGKVTMEISGEAKTGLVCNQTD
jgi:hypothetical protein